MLAQEVYDERVLTALQFTNFIFQPISTFELIIAATDFENSPKGWPEAFKAKFKNRNDLSPFLEHIRCQLVSPPGGRLVSEGTMALSIPYTIIMTLKGDVRTVLAAIEDASLHGIIAISFPNWFPHFEILSAGKTPNTGKCIICREETSTAKGRLVTIYPSESVQAAARRKGTFLQQDLKIYYHRRCVRCPLCNHGSAAPDPVYITGVPQPDDSVVYAFYCTDHKKNTK